jgi:hypothetical protein
LGAWPRGPFFTPHSTRVSRISARESHFWRLHRLQPRVQFDEFASSLLAFGRGALLRGARGAAAQNELLAARAVGMAHELHLHLELPQLRLRRADDILKPLCRVESIAAAGSVGERGGEEKELPQNAARSFRSRPPAIYTHLIAKKERALTRS